MHLRDYLKLVLAAHLLLYLALGFDIPLLRQVIAFAYLTFVPGLVILKALKLKTKKLDTALFSAGLSIAFLMFIGLVMSAVFPLLGIPEPLSLIPLVIAISMITLLLAVVSCRRDWTSRDSLFLDWPRSKETILRSGFLLVLPIVATVGALLDNTLLLLIMLLAIAVLYMLSFSSKVMPSKLYVLVIFAVSVTLVLHSTLLSKRFMGWDVHFENYVFSSTRIKGYWTPPSVGVDNIITRFESVLSITILPTVYSLLMNAEGETIFKIIFPLIFCLVPLVLYRTYEIQTNKLTALVSVLFLISNPISFYGPEPLSLARQIIGELFMVLSILVLVENKIAIQKRRILFFIFGSALVLSHYALSYLYIFFLIFAFVMMRKWRSRELLNASMILLLFAATFSWYLYVSNAPLMKLSDDIQRVYRNFLADILRIETRSPVLTPLTSQPTSIVGLVHRLVFYVENLFIVTGIAVLVFRRKKTGFNVAYRWMSIMSMVILLMCLAIPYFAASFQLTRFYAITILFLAPFFAVGGQEIFNQTKKLIIPITSRFFSKFKTTSFKNITLQAISIVLIASFLFNVGVIDHLTMNYPESLPLDRDRRKTSTDVNMRLTLYDIYVPEQDVFSATWFSSYTNNGSYIYADEASRYHVLASYALIESYSLPMYPPITIAGYAYMSSANVIEGPNMQQSAFNVSEFASVLDMTNKVYSNGASDLYYTAPPLSSARR
jgi:uncharacterized membrane protein